MPAGPAVNHRFGLLSYPGAGNLGDVIQSLAAKQYLPRVDLLLPRELISAAPPGIEPVKVILNGWFMHKPRNWPPHPLIDPLLVSMHFAENEFGRMRQWMKPPYAKLLTGRGGDFLRQWGPVGARDQFTLENLQAFGIDAYLSGCLTLTLDRPSSPRGDYIVAADLPQHLLAHLATLTDREIIVVTHAGVDGRNQAEQEAAAEEVLALYSRAAAVVTPRIHAAFPCLAFDTPVLLLLNDYHARRIADAAMITHSSFATEFLACKHDFDFADPPANPTGFRPMAERLSQTCRQFIAETPATFSQSD